MSEPGTIPTVLGPPSGVEAPEGSSAGASVETQAEQGSPRSTLDLDATVGRYTVLEMLGRGGMGMVLRARDDVLGRTLAIKLLHPGTSERDALRLRREAQALAKLSHPNIVRVYEVGCSHGRWFIAMELVEGQTLRRWQQGHGWRECVEVYLQAGEGLVAAHTAGLVHRDFKPDNCIIDSAGRPRVLDFGLVRGTTPSEDGESGESDVGVEPSDLSITRAGAVLGTLAYMSLEQLDGRAVDARSDQFSFCVAVYEALYGERPFAGNGAGALTMALVRGEVRPPPRHTRVPRRVRRVVVRGLSTDPGDRWPSMDALLSELRRAMAPKRMGLPLSLVGAAAVVGAWLWWPRAEVEPPCRDAQAQLDGVWDEECRRVLETAILGTELPYAADTWERIGHGLDEYAAAWVAKHTEICEATSVQLQQVPEVMDLRMRCLERQRIELQEAVGVLVQANATRVQQAVGLVSSLPAPSRCDDVEALAAELPPPEDPGVAQAVQALRKQLALVHSLQRAGETERALREAMAVVDRAQVLGYAPLYAEALYARGFAQARQGQYAEAEEDLERAYLLAVEHGHEALAVQAVARLANVVGHDRAEHERGLWWSRTGLARNERLGNDPAAAVDLVVTTGTLLADQGKLDEALAYYRRALAIMEAAGSPPIDIANTLGNIGSVLNDQGELDEALAYYRRALAIWEGALGPEHPLVASALNNIGSVLSDQGDQDEALAYYRRALAIWEGALGPEHPHVGSTLANIGNVLLIVGETDQALDHLRRTLAIWDQALGPQHPLVGQLLVNIGNALRYQGELDQSLDHLRRGLAVLEEGLPPGHPDLGLVLDNLGTTLEAMGRYDEAAEHYQRAISIWEAALGPRHPRIAMSLVGLAEIDLTRHDHVTARQRAERALELRESGEVAPFLLAEARFLLARTLSTDRGERERARQLAEQALAIFAEIGGIHERERATRVREWLQRPEPVPTGGAGRQ